MMKSLLLICATMALLIGAQGAYAIQATKANGTFPPTTTLKVVPTQGLSTIYTLSIGNITGTFSGYYYSSGNISVAANGLSATYIAIDTCYCTFTDSHGATYGITVFLEKGAVVDSPQTFPLGHLLSTAVVQQSTIKGLTGYVIFSGTANQLTFVNYGTYTGVLTDP